MKYYILADPHFGHKGISEWGGYPKNFEEKIINSLTKDITKDDILICLGDVSFGSKQEVWHELIAHKIYKKILVLGNHDKNSITWYQKYWDFVCEEFMFTRYGRQLLFSHKPVKIEGTQVNIHGHFHEIPFERCFKFEPELQEIYTKNHILVNFEHGYSVQSLDSIMKRLNKNKE